MEKHKQVIAEGSWNSSRISEQVEHTAPIALDPWQTQSVWYLFISIHILKSCLNSKLCKQANRRERKRNKKKKLSSHSDFPLVLDGDGLVHSSLSHCALQVFTWWESSMSIAHFSKEEDGGRIGERK